MRSLTHRPRACVRTVLPVEMRIQDSRLDIYKKDVEAPRDQCIHTGLGYVQFARKGCYLRTTFAFFLGIDLANFDLHVLPSPDTDSLLRR